MQVEDTKNSKRNWKTYNEKLKQRGRMLLVFDKDFFDELYFSGEQKHGGTKIYSDKMFEYMLTIKVMLKMPHKYTMESS